MDYRQLQDILTQDIDQLKELRDRLSSDGEELSVTDKQLLREQLSGNWMREMQEDQRHFFNGGHKKDMDQNFSVIFKIMDELQ